MNTQQAVLTIVVAACFFLSVVALSKGGKEEGNRQFGLMTFLAGCWAIVSFFEEERVVFYIKIFLVRADFLIALLLSILFLSFSQKFAKFELGKQLRLIVLCLNITTAVLTLTPLVITGVFDKGGGQISIMNGELFAIYAVVIFLNFLLGIYALIAGYLKSNGVRKRQLYYVSLGLVFTIVIAVSTNIVVPQILQVSSLVPRIGIYSMLIYLATTTFAITQHGLFNIKVIATQLFVGLLLLAILGRILTSDTMLDIVYESVLFCMSLLFGFFLVRSVNSEVERREEVEVLAKEKTAALGEVEERNKNLA
ncbi:MAG: histidine kinase N-terminal 7TM domain-containing protein, partial [Patescibacteria group bacterium]